MIAIKYRKPKRRLRIGPIAQKIMLLLATGITLSITSRPDQYFRIIRLAPKEWQRINQRSLRNAIRRLYQSQIVDYQEHADGSITLVLSKEGRSRALRYNIDTLKIKKPLKWDGFWRVIIFDIPEYKKQARDAFSQKLKNVGMMSIQKSVFVCPYECREEIDFISEILEVKPYVRSILAKDIDIALDLKHKFRLL